jgi:hypothetical protein
MQTTVDKVREGRVWQHLPKHFPLPYQHSVVAKIKCQVEL